MRTAYWITILIIITLPATAQLQVSKKGLLYSDNFQLLQKDWVIEMEPTPNSSVTARHDALVMNCRGGATVWLNKILTGDVLIEFKRTVRMEGKENDRLSDLNFFWMATDPKKTNLFTRHGLFAEYDSLQLYYVGMGGNDNTTTRFRKYDGTGNRILIQEHGSPSHLLKAEKTYHIQIVVKNGETQCWVDGQCFFRYADPSPLRQGYFGFRILHSRQEIRDFKIYRL